MTHSFDKDFVSPKPRQALMRGLRMSTVAAAAIATLASLPGWLRDIEAAPLHASIPPAPLEELGSPPAPPAPAQVNRDAARHQLLAEFLAKRYRVSRESLERFVRLAYAAGHSTRVDPLLILAVMAVESNFNPIAESVMGAKGLMQIIPQYHQDKLRAPHGGEANVLDPEVNITAGAKVLREYATRTGEDLAAALRLYGGTGPDPENSYPSRVLSERQRLEQLIRRVQDRQAAGAAQQQAGSV
jgi:soluble lytic murein transglycosylase-like protein